jgi:hypothetical protein
LWTAEVRASAEAIDFSVLHRAETGYGAHPEPIYRVPGAVSPGVKQSRREADHSLPSSTEVKNGDILPLPHTTLHGVLLNGLSTGRT